MKIFLIIFLLFLSYSFPSFSIDTKSKQAIVLDWNNNEFLFEKNPDQKVAPASMTKIMTSYIIFDKIKNSSMSINDKCKVSPKAYRMGGSRMFLEIDDLVTISDLLRGIIVQSGNDAAVVAAECLSGTEEEFANLMNRYAKKLNLNNTNFTNSSGWPGDNHYSSVRDIAIISSLIIRDFPNLYTYFKEQNFEYNNIEQPNRNRLLTEVLGSDGLKTGFTKESGWGIAASALREERRIVVVINGSNSSRNRLNESANLINWAFRETNPTTILKKNQIIKNIDVWLGNKSNINLVIEEDIIKILSFDQINSIDSYIEYENPFPAPFNKGDKLGQIHINISGKDKLTIPLIAESDVKLVNPLVRFFAAIKYLIFGNSLDE